MIESAVIKQIYLGDGETTQFPFAFPFDEAEHVKVAIYDIETETETRLESDYYVDAAASKVLYPGYPPGEEPPESERPGPLPVGQKIVIYRDTPINQLEDLGEKYPLQIIEDMIDKATMILQEFEDKLARALIVEMASDITPQEFYSNFRAGVTTAIEKAGKASASATLASNSATSANNSKIAAATSETNAGNSAIAAATSETNAGNSATAAGNSATAAGNSATAAHNSEVAAAGSANAAAKSAAEAAGINYLIRQNSTYYEEGVVAFYQTIPSPLVLECTTAGTTASTAPDFSGAAEGDTIADNTVVWTYRSLLSSGGAGVSIGTIFAHGSSTNPEGALLCDGAAVSRTMYADLFDTVGTKYGSGDGNTTFNLPDLTDAIISKTVTKTAYTTAGSSTFTAAKSGLYKITIKGGGGGGQTGVTNYSGAGGGEGGTTITYQQLSVGDTATITVGAGGATETDGGDSSVVVNSTTYTGGGGYAGNNGGGGGSGTIPGVPGGSNIYYTTSWQPGGQGGGAGGGKANSVVTSPSDANGVSGGGGAGGFTNHYSPAFYTGGSGGDGYVWIEYLGDATAYYIQAFNASTDPALVDLTQIVQDLANKATRSLDNLTAAGEAKLANASKSVVYEDGFAIIYPNGGTEANPATVTKNTRYVDPNPFPGYCVACQAEVQYNGEWGSPGFQYYTTTGGGVVSSQLSDGSIITQTAITHILSEQSNEQGDPFGATTDRNIVSLPCRVKVWKIGKVANNA